jgi:2-polyprenyl-3-methyl-5-hydroxy-6-metoxy-1,4-benzoquinol methylase
MMRQLQSGVASVLLRISRKYHSHVVRSYWENTDDTHADMTAAAFGFYTEQIRDLLGAPGSCGAVLDHGAGDGGIGTRLAAMGYDVQFSEFAPHFIQRIISAGYTCYAANAVPADSFDTIFSNNAIFYVHPSRIVSEIRWLLGRLRGGGRLLLLDVPTMQRAHRLSGGALLRATRRLTGVYQPQAGGFFIDEKRIAREFPGTRISVSWCDYRAHLELRR